MMDVSVKASMHKHRRTTLERIEKYISETYFTDVNLRGKLYIHKKPIEDIFHSALPPGRKEWQKHAFSEIISRPFQSKRVGDSFGPTWSTHWFKVEVYVPDSWIGQEVILRWKCETEAMVWSESGNPLQGLSTGISHQMRSDFRISKCWSPLEGKRTLTYYIEMACNNMFGAGKDGMINPPDVDRKFTLQLAEVCAVDKQVRKLLLDLEVLHSFAKKLSDDPRGYDALYYGNHMINSIIQGDLSLASRIGDNFFSKRNGGRAHTLALMGHCHIDSAWLWPYSETKRKCARSWASTLQLMRDYPEMKFTCSQAQQFEWVKIHFPSLYSEIKVKVQEGRFIPVGGSWVEMDGLIPSGESFMRQFLYGQRFFQEEFGKTCKEFWLPDTFGYASQIPQICKQFGITRFLTQKLSWSLVNKFPHHNFLWEGLDGTTILAHFPPGDSYEMNVTVDEAIKTVQNLEDKGRVSTSAFLYGYGDGGGGPTADMLERARRLKDVDGCPKMEHMTPDDFFQRLEREQDNLCRWVGELYLELHNGTYTSQANTKRQNRECEFALRNAEITLVVATIRGLLTSDQTNKFQKRVQMAWKKVLLNQFHDVIPGSSIGIVYEDSDLLYQEAMTVAKEVTDLCLDLILKDSSNEQTDEDIVVNTLPWSVKKVLKIEDDISSPQEKRMKLEEALVQPITGGGRYVPVEALGIGYSKLISVDEPKVKVYKDDGNYVLENQFIRAVISKYGVLRHLKLNNENSRDVFQTPDDCKARRRGNQITLYDDIPLFWDAWDTMDYHLETATVLNDGRSENITQKLTVVEDGPFVVRLKWSLRISKSSSLTQEIILTSLDPYLTFDTRVEWHENRKFLKVAFDTGLHARKATFDTQFGFLERPTHVNTSWESAMYEVCGHKWADLSEYDLGLSVLNDSKYGWTCRGSTLTLSLLRSPKAPDDQCDMGSHHFKYALMPHEGTFQKALVQRKAYEFNTPPVVKKCQRLNNTEDKWFMLEGEGAMIEAIKLCEDDNRNVVVRIYEMYGAHTKVRLMINSVPSPISAHLCNGLEEPLSPLHLVKPKGSKLAENYFSVELNLSPFKIVNVLLKYVE